MDRRRFVPSPEGLEVRLVLSNSTVNNLTSVVGGAGSQAAATTLPQTIEQRLQRVQNLPYFLSTFGKDRYLPPESIAEIQVNLIALIGKIQSPPSRFLQNFNVTLRKVIPNASLSSNSIQMLNNSFTKALQAAGTAPETIAGLVNGMTGLAKADANSVNPTILATNDYSLVLQTAFGIGRPLAAPGVPTVSTGDRLNRLANVSKTATPTLVGVYEANSLMQVVDQAGNVLGTAATESNGQYSVQITTPLANGSYKVYVRAIDTGYVSLTSRPLNLKIQVKATAAKVPAGPMAFR